MMPGHTVLVGRWGWRSLSTTDAVQNTWWLVIYLISERSLNFTNAIKSNLVSWCYSSGQLRG